MDINKLLKAGKKACGRVLKLLPRDGEDGIGSPLEYMMRTLEDDTLMSINILHPMLIKKTFSTGFLTPVDVHSDEVLDLAVDNQLMNKVMNDDRYSMYRMPLSLTDGHEFIIHEAKTANLFQDILSVFQISILLIRVLINPDCL